MTSWKAIAILSGKNVVALNWWVNGGVKSKWNIYLIIKVATGFHQRPDLGPEKKKRDIKKDSKIWTEK